MLGCSGLAMLAVVAAACLGFCGGAQAAAPPDPDTVGLTTISHIELNGVLGTELTVAPGQDVKIKANWQEDSGLRPASGCEGCYDFVATSFSGNPVAGCIENQGEFPGSGSGEVDLGPAPMTGGTYNVVAQFEQEVVSCGKQWQASASAGYQVIARVTVAKMPTALAATPQIVIFPPPYGVGLFHVSATLTSEGEPLASEPISFSVGKTALCSTTTEANGTATCKISIKGELAVLFANSYAATFAGDSTHLESTATTGAVVLGTLPHL